MQKSSIYIYFVAASIGCMSSIYFLLLILHLPLIVSGIATLSAFYFIAKWLMQLKTVEDEYVSPVKYAILIYGLFSIAYTAPSIALKHGAWDAWAIWNLHAGYLQDSHNWKNMFLNTSAAHADYPLALPASIAFIHKLAGDGLWINYMFHFLIAISIPAIIYLQTHKRSWLLSAIAFILICKDDFYITLATYQMADTMIAFFLLLAMIAIDNIDNDKRYRIVSAAMLGCCIWTKNEGIMLALLFLLFFYKELLYKKAYRDTLIGIALPLIAYVIFKTGFATQNDIMGSQSSSTLSLFADTERYKLIFTAWKDSINMHYYTISCVVALCILLAVLRGKFPDRKISFVFAACIAYSVVYMITPHDLSWHLKTSIDRLIHQLMPASAYACIVYLANTSFFNFRARFVTNPQSPE